jgi:spermidine synthase
VRKFSRIVYAFAFFSATAALVYQIAWARLLALTFGRTALATSAVLAGFMGGMAIGAWLYHRAAGARAPLRVYAALEFGIALSSGAVTLALGVLPGAFAALAVRIPAGLAMDLARVGLVFALLLVPAALMGATFPALCALLIRSRDGVGRHLGWIYGLNTLGAAAGALAAGFALIEWLGVRGAIGLVIAINAGIGLLASWLARRSAVRNAPRAALGESDALLPTRLPRWATGTVLFGSGFATLAYEIVWFRALQYLFGNATYSLTSMLAIFLLGLGIGGALFGRVARRSWPERDLALCQLAVALLALAAIGAEAAVLAHDRAAAQLSAFSPEVVGRVWWGRLLADAGLGLALLLPATLCMGLSFPLATRLFVGDVRRLDARVGMAVALANGGSILGAVVAAIALLPQLGTVGATRAIAALNLALGCFVLMQLRAAPRRRAAWIVAAGTAFALIAASLPARLAFRGEGRAILPQGALAFEEEGDLATVQVWEGRDRAGARAMTIDGVVIAVSRGDFYPVYSKQKLLAHLPMILDASIARTLSIGLGSGSTLHALASYPSIERLDAVEISAGVVRASALFAESEVLDDPRTQLTVEDALHHLLRHREAYDLIVSDGKQNPEFSKNWTLMSREFYAGALDRLGDDGLLVQWLPLATLASDFAVALRTFADVFPEVEVFLNAPHWVIAVGSRAPIAGRPRWHPEVFRQLAARADLSSFRIGSREALLSYWVADRTALMAELGAGPISTWNHSPLEFSTYKTAAAVKARAPYENLAMLVRAHARAMRAGGSPFVPAGSAYLRSSALLRRAHRRELEGDRSGARQLVERALEVNPGDAVARHLREQLGAPTE